jgi:hypothetical protein
MPDGHVKYAKSRVPRVFAALVVLTACAAPDVTRRPLVRLKD